MTTPPPPPPPISLRPILKRPKLEHEEEEGNNNNNHNGAVSNNLEEEAKEKGDEESKKNNVSDLEEQEEALLALIEHRTKEVQHLHKRIAHYQSQREAAEIRLQDSQSALARLRARCRENGLSVSNVSQSQLNETKSTCDRENGSLAFKASLPNETKSTSDRENGSSAFKVSQPNEIKSTSDRENGSSAFKVSQRTETKSMNEEPKLTSPLMKSSKTQPQRKTELVIPSVIPETSFAKKPSVPTVKAASTASSVRASPSTSTSGMVKVKTENPSRTTPDPKVVERKEKGLKRKLEEKQHKELISLIRSNSKAGNIRFNTSNYFPSQHKRKLRSLSLCPVNDQLFVTSALDGMMNLWQLHSRGLGATLVSTTDCASPDRRWPEDISWHPDGDRLFCAYTADNKDSQISMINFNKTHKRDRVTFLEDKPHVKGIINSLIFVPWEKPCFVTGGSDHAVILWSEKDVWKPKVLHRNLHSSAVMGVSGMHQKPIVVSAGADKRIVGFDVDAERADFRHQIDSKCMSVLTNPCDFNLFMVQTGTHEKQLHLYDVRLRQTELHVFGWKQESSDSQSALINQSWSPDGLKITSGSADPKIHIFDIRYNGREPCHSLRAHQKRVFKAEWHFFHPLLISISSDLNIGLHKIV